MLYCCLLFYTRIKGLCQITKLSVKPLLYYGLRILMVIVASKLQCPDDTRYCFEKGRNPETYSEEKKELCKGRQR